MNLRSLCVLLLCLFCSIAHGQEGLRTGHTTPDFALAKILNHTSSSASFNTIKRKLTLIDFFGTWCAPCIKALPHLTSIQQQFKDQLQVVLVSIEDETKLRQFISKRKDFIFPMVIDEDNSITNLFQPPSYPYTVIVDEQGKIVATVTKASDITEIAINNWLTNKATIMSSADAPQKIPTENNTRQISASPVVRLSQEFLYAAKTGDDVASFETQLKNISLDSLQLSLQDEDTKKAFWINIYNAYSNSILKKNPEKYTNRNVFFKSKQIELAGQHFSLDDIEHDILRRSKVKWGLGYLNKWFPATTIKKLRVNKVDYRIHFALNCGAKSCPPIAYYTPEKIDNQLEMATKNYLNNEVEYDSNRKLVKLPAIMSWFRGDFGGKNGMRSLLKKNGLIPKDPNPKIAFKKYDWTLELNNYKTESE